MGLRNSIGRLAESAADPMNDPRLSLSDKALAIAIGVQVEQATLRAMRQYAAEQMAMNEPQQARPDQPWRADGML